MAAHDPGGLPETEASRLRASCLGSLSVAGSWSGAADQQKTPADHLICPALSGHKVKHAAQCRALGLVELSVTASAAGKRAVSGSLDIKYFRPEATGHPDLADVKFEVLAFRTEPLFILHTRSSSNLHSGYHKAVRSKRETHGVVWLSVSNH